ncbi:MAG: hypothetical protein KBG70_08040 [Chitinophagales bacterium]|nr:hypothetical protein [Chitinophagales bacterium]
MKELGIFNQFVCELAILSFEIEFAFVKITIHDTGKRKLNAMKNCSLFKLTGVLPFFIILADIKQILPKYKKIPG